MREIELKFAVHPSFHLEAILGQAGVAAITSLEPLTLSATYYDTHDLRLARSGVTVRYRTGEDEPTWTVKLPRDSGGVVREELTYAGSEEEVPPEAVEIVGGFTRTAPVEPVATLLTKRERWLLSDDAAEDLAVLYQDDVAVVEDGRTLTRFREIELESMGVGLGRLRKIGAALTAAGAVATEPVPKAIRALGPRATAPPDVPAAAEVIGDSAAAAVQLMLATAVERITSHHADARLGDGEGVHQMRVGTRRLRSDLRTFGALVEPAWAKTVSDDLKWLARLLGDVRDLDVLTARFDAAAADLRTDLEPLFASLDSRARQCRAALHEGLRSQRYRLLLETLVRAAQNPPVTVDAALPVAQVLTPRLVPVWRKLHNAVREAGRNPTDEELHDIRIRVKRARYAAEAVAASSGEHAAAAGAFAAAAAKLQSVLGAHQDAIMATMTLREIVMQPEAAPEFALALGRVLERQHVAAEQARRRWLKAWRTLKRPKHLAWLPA